MRAPPRLRLVEYRLASARTLHTPAAPRPHKRTHQRVRDDSMDKMMFRTTFAVAGPHMPWTLSLTLCAPGHPQICDLCRVTPSAHPLHRQSQGCRRPVLDRDIPGAPVCWKGQRVQLAAVASPSSTTPPQQSMAPRLRIAARLKISCPRQQIRVLTIRHAWASRPFHPMMDAVSAYSASEQRTSSHHRRRARRLAYRGPPA